jgi:transcriptional regulator with XRE-family HTH domain
MNFEQWLNSPEARRELARERLIVNVGEDLLDHMNAIGLTRADLARRLGVSKARVTKLLSGEANLTLRTLADFAQALDLEPMLRFNDVRPNSISLDERVETSAIAEVIPLYRRKFAFVENRDIANAA